MIGEPFRLETGVDGVARVVCDGPPSLLSFEGQRSLARVLDRIECDPDIVGAILLLPPSTAVDPDLERVLAATTAGELEERSLSAQRTLSRLESLEKPIVAAISGPCLGGAFELALACHGRVAADDPAVVVALPAVRVGLVPPAGGLSRLVALAGLKTALSMAIGGARVSPARARVVDAVVAADGLEDAARARAATLVGAPRTVPARSVSRLAREANPVGRALTLRRSRSRAMLEAHGHHPAAERALEVLELHASGGSAVAGARVAKAFGELGVTETVARLIEHARAAAAVRSDADALAKIAGEADVIVTRLRRAPLVTGRPTRVGLHHPGTALRGRLVEIVALPETHAPALAAAVARARAEGQTPIVVADRPGLFVARITAAAVIEATRLLAEGVSAEAIDRAMERWGFPRGPVALIERIGLTVATSIADELADDLGERFALPGPLATLVADGRRGRAHTHLPGEEIQMRIALSLVNEVVRALDEGVVRSARDADVAAVLGAGFPRFRGGPLRYVDVLGAKAVVARLESLEARVSGRFTPAAALALVAREGRKFHTAG
jgi:3-hydroxyacyl-CoA dehydrogenase/enoyl-CoA hydratase/3-hydroxybutyryl-CoA epimerase